MRVSTRIDWVTATWDTEWLQWLLFGARLEKERLIRGRNGYSRGWQLRPAGKLYHGSKNERMGAMLSLTGAELDELRENWDGWVLKLLKLHSFTGKNLSRIDIAIDVFSDEFSPDLVMQKAREGSVLTRLTQPKAISSTEAVETVYFGKRGSGRRLVRVYDKNVEQGVENPETNWTRIEMQTGRGSKAVSKMLVRGDDIRSIIKKYWHIQACPVWDEICDVPASKGVHIKDEKPDTLDWLLSSAAPALGRYLADVEMSENPDVSPDSVIESFFKRVRNARRERLSEYV